MRAFINRIIGAAKLDIRMYAEIKADRTAMGQAMVVVVLSGLAGGIGFIQQAALPDVLIGIAGSLFGWFVLAFLTYVIGTKVLAEPQTHATLGELLRTIGFSSAPGMIRVFGLSAAMANTVNVLAIVWMLIAMFVAVRHTLDYQSPYRPIIVCLIGWIVQAAIVGWIVLMMGVVPEHPA